MSCSTSERSHSDGDGSKRSTRTLEGLCDGSFCYAQRARQDGRWQDSYQNICGVTFDGLLIPFGTQISHKPISSNDEAELRQVGNKMLFGIFMGYVLRAREEEDGSGHLLVADCEGLEHLSVSDTHVKRCNHQEVAQEVKLMFPCAERSQILRFTSSAMRRSARQGNLSKMEKKKRTPFSKKWWILSEHEW